MRTEKTMEEILSSLCFIKYLCFEEGETICNNAGKTAGCAIMAPILIYNQIIERNDLMLQE